MSYDLLKSAIDKSAAKWSRRLVDLMSQKGRASKNKAIMQQLKNYQRGTSDRMKEYLLTPEAERIADHLAMDSSSRVVKPVLRAMKAPARVTPRSLDTFLDINNAMRGSSIASKELAQTISRGEQLGLTASNKLLPARLQMAAQMLGMKNLHPTVIDRLKAKGAIVTKNRPNFPYVVSSNEVKNLADIKDRLTSGKENELLLRAVNSLVKCGPRADAVSYSVKPSPHIEKVKSMPGYAPGEWTWRSPSAGTPLYGKEVFTSDYPDIPIGYAAQRSGEKTNLPLLRYDLSKLPKGNVLQATPHTSLTGIDRIKFKGKTRLAGEAPWGSRSDYERTIIPTEMQSGALWSAVPQTQSYLPASAGFNKLYKQYKLSPVTVPGSSEARAMTMQNLVQILKNRKTPMTQGLRDYMGGK